MKKKLDHIEELFHQELNNLNVAPDERFEQLIMDQIDFERKKRKSWPFFLIALILLIGGCSALLCAENLDINQKSRNTNQTSLNHKTPSRTASNFNTETPAQINQITNKAVQLKDSTETFIHKNSVSNIDRSLTISQTSYSLPNQAIDLDPDLASNNHYTGLNQRLQKSSFGSNQTLIKDQPLLFNLPLTYSLQNKLHLSPIPFNSETSNTLMLNMGPPVYNENKINLPKAPVYINKRDSTVNYKQAIGIGTQFLIPSKTDLAYDQQDERLAIKRDPIKNFRISYTNKLFLNFIVESGFQYENWAETWEKESDTTQLVTKDTIIDGEPAVITYEQTVTRKTVREYSSKSFGLPLSIGYMFRLTDNFHIGPSIGGILTGTIIKESTSSINSTPVNLTKRQTSFTFNPKYSLNANFMFNHFGIGLSLNYAGVNLGKIDFFEQGLNRKSLGGGLLLFYAF